jgi:uncharacterized protein with HEPN domain
LKAVKRIQSYVVDVGGIEAIIDDDYVHRDGVERQLLIVAEAAAKLRGQVEALEPSIDWDAIRGMGNVLRHDYDGVDDDIIRHVLSNDLVELTAACERLRAHFPMPASI